MGNLDRYFGRIVDCLSFIDDPRKRMTILGDRAAAAARNGDYRAAHSLAARALWMARRYNDTQIEAWAWSQAGMYFWEAEEYPKARKAYQESLALYQESGDAEGIALGSRAVGSILIEEGDIKNAEPLLLRSIGIYRKLDHPVGTAICLTNLADIAASRHDNCSVIRYEMEALKLFEKANREDALPNTLFQLAAALVQVERFEEALAYSQRCLEIHRSPGKAKGLERASMLYGWCKLAAGDRQEGDLLLGEGLELARKLRDIESFSYLATIQWMSGDADESVRLFREALEIVAQDGLDEWHPIILNNIGYELAHTGRLDEAEPLLLEARQLHDATKHSEYNIYVLNNLGDIMQLRGLHKEAAPLYKQSLTLKLATNDRWASAYSLEGLAGCMAALGEPHIGSVLLGGAGAIREKLCSPIEPRLRGWLEDIQNRVESALGEAEYIEALAEGKAMSFEEMIAFAMECNAGIEC